MSPEIKIVLATAFIYLWVGFVCAISFMEAWLKFKAPGVTLPIGLGIGRLVFNALNKVEWIFALGVMLLFLFLQENFFPFKTFSFYLPLSLLIVQTFWLLPALDARAEMHIKGIKPPSSYLHFYYVVTEVIKVVSLIVFSFKLFK